MPCMYAILIIVDRVGLVAIQRMHVRNNVDMGRCKIAVKSGGLVLELFSLHENCTAIPVICNLKAPEHVYYPIPCQLIVIHVVSEYYYRTKVVSPLAIYFKITRKPQVIKTAGTARPSVHHWGRPISGWSPLGVVRLLRQRLALPSCAFGLEERHER